MSGGQWFFFLTPSGDIGMLARFESDDGTIIGDAAHTVRPGEVFEDGISYETLKAAGGGVLRHDGKRWVIGTA